jgi:hypothetical protein
MENRTGLLVKGKHLLGFYGFNTKAYKGRQRVARVFGALNGGLI